jgi:hypothetical protein
MTFEVPLNLDLRSNRDYFRAVDIFEAIHTTFAKHLRASKLTQISFKVQKFYDHSLRLIMTDEKIAEGNPDWFCSVDGKSWRGHLLENKQGAKPTTAPLDETWLINHTKIDGHSAFIHGDQIIAPIECAAFLSKSLLSHLQPLEYPCLWALIDLDLKESLPPQNEFSTDALKVTLDTENKKMARSATLFYEGHELGILRFRAVDMMTLSFC